MAARDRASFGKMCRTFPVRTALFTAGPLAVGSLQLLNLALNGGSVLVGLALVALTACFAVLVTRYHLAAFRVSDLYAGAEAGTAPGADGGS